MQSPGRKRPQKRQRAADVAADVLARCAETAEYVGSPEHKTFPSFAGRMQARSDATKCLTHLKDPQVVRDWLRRAIRAGDVSAEFDGDYPRYVWAYVDAEESWFEARLTNAGLGQYKGYPLLPSQAPRGVVGAR